MKKSVFNICLAPTFPMAGFVVSPANTLAGFARLLGGIFSKIFNL
jgi:hypothetical protein